MWKAILISLAVLFFMYYHITLDKCVSLCRKNNLVYKDHRYKECQCVKEEHINIYKNYLGIMK